MNRIPPRAVISLLPDDSEKWLEWGRIRQLVDLPERVHLVFMPVEEEKE